MRFVVRFAALCFFVQILFAFIGPPDTLVEWLTGENLAASNQPRYVVVLGGSGMPSGSTLLRTWRAAQFGHSLTGATFIVSLPADESPETSSVGRMRDELVLRGIPAELIQMETRGRDTHEQAVNALQLIGAEHAGDAVVIITSGYHMRRALLCFQKAGFKNVTGVFATSASAEAEAGAHRFLRYGMWTNWASEVEISRELTALFVYKLRGWI